jgi:hypothetical protein
MKTSLPVLIAGLYITAASSLAPCAVSIDIDVAPPEPRVEVVPAARVGYVWAPGYWEWREGAHVWVPGHWIGERRGYHWVADRWGQVGGHWHHFEGHWER